jgi:hypothetical protein
MSDFFAGLRGSAIQGPDAVFDQSSIMPSGGGPHSGYQGIPDGRINATSSLLNPGQPYAYGSGDRLGSQAAYLNNPHNCQKIIPEMYFPDTVQDPVSSTGHYFPLSHTVSDGDVAWVLRYNSIENKNQKQLGSFTYKRQGLQRAVDHFVSLAGVNYLLAGMQIHQNEEINKSWYEVRSCFGVEDASEEKQIKKFVQYHATPFGVVIGSDKQGGQHQGKSGPVTWPVDYVCTVTVDGRNENMQNMWAGYKISSGDSLQFVLTKVRFNGPIVFDLSAGKYTCMKTFQNSTPTDLWQVLPVTGTQRKCEDEFLSNGVPIATYWHFATSFKSHGQRDNFADTKNISKRSQCARSFHKGALLHVVITPVWVDEDELCEGSTPGRMQAFVSRFEPKVAFDTKKRKLDYLLPTFMAQNASNSASSLKKPEKRPAETNLIFPRVVPLQTKTASSTPQPPSHSMNTDNHLHDVGLHGEPQGVVVGDGGGNLNNFAVDEKESESDVRDDFAALGENPIHDVGGVEFSDAASGGILGAPRARNVKSAKKRAVKLGGDAKPTS